MIIEIGIDGNKKRFCLICRPPNSRLTKFLDAFENLLLFLNNLNGETIILVDVNIDIPKQCYETEQYLKSFQTFDFQVQNCEPTRVTPSTMGKYIATETITTTKSDHFAIQGVFTSNTKKLVIKEEPNWQRDISKLKGENSLKFLFVRDQSLRKTDLDNVTAEDI